MRTWNRRAVVLGILASLLLAVVGALAFHVLRLQRLYHRRDALAAKLDEQIKDYRTHWRGPGRYAPPVLRGVAVDGNAMAVQWPAAKAMGLPQLPEGLKASFELCQRPDARVITLADTHAAALRTFRSAASRATSRSEPEIERGLADVPIAPVQLHLRAVDLLLVRASLSPPEECLALCTDAVRLGQQLVPGEGLVGAMIAAVDIEHAAPVITGCARTASNEQLATTAKELVSLAEHAPALGESFEIESLLGGVSMRQLTGGRTWIPTSGGEVESLFTLEIVLGAWDELARDPAQYRAIRADAYPAAVGVWTAEATRLRTSTNPLLGMGTVAFDKYLYRDMGAQALLRALAIMVDGLSRRDEQGAIPKDPSPLLKDKALADPFDGNPLHWEIDATGAMRVWSVGKDTADQRGAPGSDDVVVSSACAK